MIAIHHHHHLLHSITSPPAEKTKLWFQALQKHSVPRQPHKQRETPLIRETALGVRHSVASKVHLQCTMLRGGGSPAQQASGACTHAAWSRAPLAIQARRTVRGTTSTRSSSPERRSRSPRATSPPAKAKPQGPKPKAPGPPSKGNRFSDGALIMGDLVMIVATEVSSERIPYESLPTLLAVSAGCWVLSAVILGDYEGVPPSSDNWYLSLLGPIFMSIIDSTQTWALSVVISLAIFSVLVSTNNLDPAPLMSDLNTENLSPQLEVAVAALITMTCWRGIAARLRWM